MGGGGEEMGGEGRGWEGMRGGGDRKGRGGEVLVGGYKQCGSYELTLPAQHNTQHKTAPSLHTETDTHVHYYTCWLHGPSPWCCRCTSHWW